MSPDENPPADPAPTTVEAADALTGAGAGEPGPASTESWPTVSSIDEISGWFTGTDQAVFRHTLEWQRENEPAGTLVEMGAFMGESAVLIGEYPTPDERFVVIDLFGRTDLLEGAMEGNQREVSGSSYQWTLSQAAFEHNYRCLHGELPEVVAGLSSSVVDHVRPGEVRFCHIDASHEFDAVKLDIELCADLVRPGGVVVLDDYRTEHTPGVAAAAWGAVRDGLIVPVVLTGNKMYAVYRDADAYREGVVERLRADRRFVLGVDSIEGHTVHRVHPRRDEAAARAVAIKSRGETIPERMAREAAEAEAARVAEEARKAAAEQAARAAAQERMAREAERVRLLRESQTPLRKARRAVLLVLPPVVSIGLRRLKHAVLGAPGR